MDKFISDINHSQALYVEQLRNEKFTGLSSKKMTRKERAIEIRVRMMRRKPKRVTIAQIRRSLDPPVSHTAVYNVIEGLSTSRRIKEAIAKAVGSTVAALWPDADEERAA